jgi:hypothetical protein
MTDIPIACTLDPRRLRDRLAFIDSLAADALIGQDEIPGGVRSRFRDKPDVEARVRELVAAESSCCGFLSFEVSRRDGELWLEMTGTPEARPVIDRFFAAASSPAERQPPPSM